MNTGDITASSLIQILAKTFQEPKLAERKGFEPSNDIAITHFPGVRLQPSTTSLSSQSITPKPKKSQAKWLINFC